MRMPRFAAESLAVAVMATAMNGAAMGQPAEPDTVSVTDMVVIPGVPPFYIDIFEADCATVEAAITGSCDFVAAGTKPARLRFEQAREFCEKQGKRLPTEAEWLAAASDAGANRQYSFHGDALPSAGAGFQANIGSKRRSEASAAFQLIGIDAAGTVGMTGNRAEWVIRGNGRANGSVAVCGRDFRSSLEDARLDRLCTNDRDVMYEGATVRCVRDYTSQVRVTLSEKVTGELKTHIDRRSERLDAEGRLLDALMRAGAGAGTGSGSDSSATESTGEGPPPAAGDAPAQGASGNGQDGSGFDQEF